MIIAKLADAMMDWCDMHGKASYGQFVERGFIAFLFLGLVIGFLCGLLSGFMYSGDIQQ